MKAKILIVEKVSLHFIEGENPAIVIGAEGIVPTSGWKNAELAPRIYISPPEDGIWDFDFIAEPPNGITLQILTRIASDPFVAEVPSWLKGIRVHASNNEDSVELTNTTLSQPIQAIALSQLGLGRLAPGFEPQTPPEIRSWPIQQGWPDPNTQKELDKIKGLLACRGLTNLELLNSAAIGKPLRVHTEDDAVTKDYIANRINFVLDKTTKLVKRIYIG